MITKSIAQILHRPGYPNSGKKIKTAFMIMLLGCLLISCANDIPKVNLHLADIELPSLTAENYEMLFSDSTVIRFKLQTPEFIRHENEKEPYTEFPKGLKIIKYDANMNVISSITALFAKHFDENNRWEAKNNVVAVNLKGDTLKTEYLVWDMKKERIYSDQFVKIIQKDQAFIGTGLDANQDFTEYSFKNPKGTIYVNVQSK